MADLEGAYSQLDVEIKKYFAYRTPSSIVGALRELSAEIETASREAYEIRQKFEAQEADTQHTKKIILPEGG